MIAVARILIIEIDQRVYCLLVQILLDEMVYQRNCSPISFTIYIYIYIREVVLIKYNSTIMNNDWMGDGRKQSVLGNVLLTTLALAQIGTLSMTKRCY